MLKIAKIFILFCTAHLVQGINYNILSMDGGGIKGIITVKVIEFIEEYIKNYSISMNYSVPFYYKDYKQDAHLSDHYKRFPNGTTFKDYTKSVYIHLSDFFDMTAGTSTGSIIAAGLSCPSKSSSHIPGYFANDLLDIYVQKKEEIFAYNGYNIAEKMFFIVFLTIILGSSGYFIGYLRYNQKKKLQKIENWEKTFRNFNEIDESIQNQGGINRSQSDIEIHKQQQKVQEIIHDPIFKEYQKSLLEEFPEEPLQKQNSVRSDSRKKIVLDQYEKLDQESAELQEEGPQQNIQNEITNVNHSILKIEQMKLRIKRDQHKIWIICLAFSIIGFILGYFGPTTFAFLSKAKYKREKLEKIMNDYLGHADFSQILTDETLVVAYDYNSQQPRFYSKYFSNINPKIYGVKICTATQASSAAPTYFNPATNINQYGLVEFQIDGGIISNNPAMYAYQIAAFLNNKNTTDINIISLGTGEKDYDMNLERPKKQVIENEIQAKKFNKKDWLNGLNDFMMNIDVHAAHIYLHNQIIVQQKRSDGYIRLNIHTNVEMDTVDQKQIQQLIDQGNQLVQQSKERLIPILEKIVDQKFKK